MVIYHVNGHDIMTVMQSLYLCKPPLRGDAQKYQDRAAGGGTWPYIMSTDMI